MKIHERGVLPESNIYFHIPNENDRKLILTPHSCGYYFCDDSYKVVREKYSGSFLEKKTKYIMEGHQGSYLCLYVKEGKGYVYQNNQKVILNKNDIFLLDCYHPHVYGTFEGSTMETIWVHFDGPMIRGYFKQIANNTNCSVLKSITPGRAQIVYDNLNNIYEKFDKRKGVNDILNNKYLVIITTEFLHGNQTPEPKYNAWDDLLIYISENVQKPLKPRELAERMALSPYYFIRQFKKKIGYTPYHYILLNKMSTANHLLRHSSMSIKEISHACGFASEGSFYNAFKKIFGVWPQAYRGNMD